MMHDLSSGSANIISQNANPWILAFLYKTFGVCFVCEDGKIVAFFDE